jgi:hypothetical protein
MVTAPPPSTSNGGRGAQTGPETRDLGPRAQAPRVDNPASSAPPATSASARARSHGISERPSRNGASAPTLSGTAGARRGHYGDSDLGRRHHRPASAPPWLRSIDSWESRLGRDALESSAAREPSVAASGESSLAKTPDPAPGPAQPRPGAEARTHSEALADDLGAAPEDEVGQPTRERVDRFVRRAHGWTRSGAG